MLCRIGDCQFETLPVARLLRKSLAKKTTGQETHWPGASYWAECKALVSAGDHRWLDSESSGSDSSNSQSSKSQSSKSQSSNPESSPLSQLASAQAVTIQAIPS